MHLINNTNDEILPHHLSSIIFEPVSCSSTLLMPLISLPVVSIDSFSDLSDLSRGGSALDHQQFFERAFHALWTLVAIDHDVLRNTGGVEDVRSFEDWRTLDRRP